MDQLARVIDSDADKRINREIINHKILLCFQSQSAEMDTSRALSLLETLDDEIDDLEEALLPLVKAPLSEIASKLPLLDKAKLYVLVTYSIESMLFCKLCPLTCRALFLTVVLAYLRLHGVKAREHPVFTELTRVKQYFQKLKVAQNPVNDGAGKRENLILDKGAAQRIIAKGLVSLHLRMIFVYDPLSFQENMR